MRAYRTALIVGCIGLLTFGAVFAFLEMGRSPAVPEPVAVVVATPSVLPLSASNDSPSSSMAAGQIAVGVPSVGSEPLLQTARPGARLDVLASLPSPADNRPITVVAVSGATIVRAATLTDPLLLQVSGPDAMVLAHLVLSGTRLVYNVWPEGADPPRQPPLDERTARALLDLPPLASPARATAAPVAAPPLAMLPAPAPRPTTYTVQAGESLYSVATRLGVDSGALWWANRALVDPTVPLVVGSTLQVPLVSGFLYQVQIGDTWASVADTFGMPAADLWRRNELPEDASLVSGMLLFIPRDS